MVKMLQLLSVTTVIAAGDDSTALLQQTFAHEQSVGNRILTAVAEGGKDIICVDAAVGDIAPVPGSFTATMSQQAVKVAAGAVAEEKGSFCVQRQDVLLYQRTYGLHTANAIEGALSAKNEQTTTTTTTTTSAADVDAAPNADNFETFDFAGDSMKKVMVKQCPDKSSILMQTIEATISNKGTEVTKNLDADQERVCACRNFLKDGVRQIHGLLNDHAGEAKAVIEQEAANDGVDAGTVKDVERGVESDIKTGQIVADFGMVCNQAKELKNWTLIAKMINHPTEVVPTFEAANITGWERCDKSWIIEGACAEIVEETSLLQNKLVTEDKIDAAIHRATSDLPKVTEATAAEVDEMVESFSQDLMTTSTVLMQASATQKEALLRRAFHSDAVSNFIEGYTNLPAETKHKVVHSALGSEDLVTVFEAMPAEERTALLMQLDGNHMDKTVAQKTETTRTEGADGTKKTETVTRDGNGRIVHRHTHSYNARTGQTETATQSKQHVHEHTHNSKSSRTETQTVSNGHTHAHTHRHQNGQTVTDTNTNGNRHHHDHTHTHINGQTVTRTNSVTTGQNGATSSHSHSHVTDGSGTATVTSGTGGTASHTTR